MFRLTREWLAKVVPVLLTSAVIMAMFPGLQGKAGAAAADFGHRLALQGYPYIGIPYQWGADPHQITTFDCSSYTRRVFLDSGIVLPRTSGEQYLMGTAVSLQEARAGDLVFFHDPAAPGVPSHVGIYLGGGRMINATVSRGVVVTDLTTSYWQQRYLGVKRVMPALYTVKNGDTLWQIADQAGLALHQLIAWNKLDGGDRITAGQTLFMSDPDYTRSGPGVIQPGGGHSPNPAGAVYTVRPGDSLWLIQQQTGVPIADLRRWNHLSSDWIFIGQQLMLQPPAYPYTVAAGDTLWLISRRTGATVEAIQARNGLAGDEIWIGAVLMIPAL